MKALIVAAVIILSALLVCQALSLNQSMSILNSGRILVMQSRVAESQWRGISIGQGDISGNPNWTLMASTCASYGVNFVDIDCIRNYETMYPSVVVSQTGADPPINFTQAIRAFHAYGIQVYAHFSTMYKAYNQDGVDRGCYFVPNNNVSQLQEYYPGTNSGWLDIANPATPPLIHNLINELVSNYSIDGIVFDYTRFDDFMMPVGQYDFAQFKADTGLDTSATYSQWVSDVCPASYAGGTGLYTTQFLVWRTELVNTFVKNITQWALAINPNLKFGASPHSIFDSNPDYWSYEQGQDAAYWISQGYIQFVMPMMYTNDTSSLRGNMQAWETYTTGGAHGIIPIVPYITDGDVDPSPTNYTTTAFASIVSTLLANGADGWIVAYGKSPGAGTGQTTGQDIRPFLSAIGLPSPTTFTITDLTVTVSGSNATIHYNTSLAVNSTLQYNLPPSMYTWSYITAYDMVSTGFPYWQNTYNPGTIVSNSTLDTSHTFTLTGLSNTTYSYQVRSIDASGTAFSAQLTFSAG